ncbi:MAG: metallophosphoesterase [Bacteroidales bacterium]
MLKIALNKPGLSRDVSGFKLFILFLSGVLLNFSCGSADTLNSEEDDYTPVVNTEGYSEILCRPGNNSMSLSILFDYDAEVYWEYGTSPGDYSMKTATERIQKSEPRVAVFSNLLSDSRYYYRTRFRKDGDQGSFGMSLEHSFHTARNPGSSFTFTIESDEHLYDKKGITSMYKVCLENQALDRPDFMLSLGDIFGNDHFPYTITAQEIDVLHENYRPLIGTICHSIPLLICLGNHEGENDYFMKLNPPDNLAINGTLARKKYFPNPYPDGFYSGNPVSEPYGIGNPENYYSWTWGDALFIVLDLYRYQNQDDSKPKGWDWTMGREQYLWLKKTLESSSSKYKFVFAHHVGGESRGGIIPARLYEWGGYDQNGISYGFPDRRPGFEMPVHDLLASNGVNIFFQGHDHLFAREELDGVVYQTVPMPSDSTYNIGYLANADAFTSDVLEGTGHLRVTVSPGGIRVDFVRAVLPNDETTAFKNRSVPFTYYIR